MKEVEYFLMHELADHYIEMIKASIYEEKNVESIQYTLYTVGLGLLKLFAPFIPFITEEIYQNQYKDSKGDNSIHVSAWPEQILDDEEKENNQGYHMACVVVTLNDGTISYADVDPELLGRVISAISPEEFGEIVAAIADAVENPQPKACCQRQ